MDAALAHQGAEENMVSQNSLLINSFSKKADDDAPCLLSLCGSAQSWRRLVHQQPHITRIAGLLDVDLAVPTRRSRDAVGAAVGVCPPTDNDYRYPANRRQIPRASAGPGILALWTRLGQARETAKQLAIRAVSAGATAVEVELTEQIKLVPLASSKICLSKPPFRRRPQAPAIAEAAHQLKCVAAWCRISGKGFGMAIAFFDVGKAPSDLTSRTLIPPLNGDMARKLVQPRHITD